MEQITLMKIVKIISVSVKECYFLLFYFDNLSVYPPEMLFLYIHFSIGLCVVLGLNGIFFLIFYIFIPIFSINFFHPFKSRT